MSRDSYRQGVDDAQYFGKPNRKLYEDPDYTDGFDGYMRDHPIEDGRDDESTLKEE